MFTTRVISTTAFLVFVTVVYVGAVPIKTNGETLRVNGGVYAEPELARALARSYAVLEWEDKNEEPLQTLNLNARTVDRIGGGNLLRSLFKRDDHDNPGVGDNAHVSHFPRQSRHGLDSLSGATFGESKRYTLPRKLEWPNNMNGLENYEGPAKRNIDEIDRTGFDNFVKRNFDEIDRSGWDSFVKRRMIDSYLATEQH